MKLTRRLGSGLIFSPLLSLVIPRRRRSLLRRLLLGTVIAGPLLYFERRQSGLGRAGGEGIQAYAKDFGGKA